MIKRLKIKISYQFVNVDDNVSQLPPSNETEYFIVSGLVTVLLL